MCGIAGIVALSEKGRQRLSKIQQSIRTLQRRGPDDEGVYANENFAFGQRRLAIIDTSKAGNQPMWDSTNRYVLIFNGEIFNYRELREKYLSKQQRDALKSTCDTEILLEMFVQMGKDCFTLLEGFFAFAIYDTKEDVLWLVRDRFGKKPLTFYKDEDGVVFGSELKALFAFGIPKSLNYDALRLYLQLAYIPQPHSILKGVYKVKPGYFIEMKGGIFREEKWYELPSVNNYSQAPTYEQAQKELEHLMEQAVVKRLISDVPLGAFLSGGIDSSVIVALASRHVKTLNTFSIGFREAEFFDETHYAELVAKKFKTNHAKFTLGIEDYLAHVFDVLNYFDEPFADTSSLPQYILCMETRKHATVAVSGDGGDEVFAGYNKHYAEWQARRKSLAGSIVRIGAPVWKMMPQGRNSRISNLFRQLDRFAAASNLSSKDRYWHWASTFSETEVAGLMHPSTLKKVDESSIDEIRSCMLRHINDHDFNSVLKTDLDLVLEGDMLVKVDLMSMANSVEVRSPFLDHHVVEFAFSIPSEYKIDGKRRKKIVKDAFRHLLPPEIYNRGKKGFEIPMLDWFRNELNSFIFEDLLKESFVREQGIFNYDSIVAMKKQLNSSAPGNIVEQLWVLIVFQHWYKKYFINN